MTDDQREQAHALLTRNRQVLAEADRTSARIQQTLNRSRDVDRRALPVLRRAGLLRTR